MAAQASEQRVGLSVDRRSLLDRGSCVCSHSVISKFDLLRESLEHSGPPFFSYGA